VSFPPVTELLPHRGAMLLLERVSACDTKRICVECTPRREAWYADARGNMPAWIGIELMAQAIAAHTGLVKRSEGKPVAPGVLLGTRSFVAAQPEFEAGQMLRVKAELSFRDESGLAAYDCSIETGGATLASATLKVFEPGDFRTYLNDAP
jgi:predicted hotdog family 3-hydroxylacyl-ACP dehydratase